MSLAHEPYVGSQNTWGRPSGSGAAPRSAASRSSAEPKPVMWWSKYQVSRALGV